MPTAVQPGRIAPSREPARCGAGRRRPRGLHLPSLARSGAACARRAADSTTASALAGCAATREQLTSPPDEPLQGQPMRSTKREKIQ